VRHGRIPARHLHVINGQTITVLPMAFFTIPIELFLDVTTNIPGSVLDFLALVDRIGRKPVCAVKSAQTYSKAGKLRVKLSGHFSSSATERWTTQIP
jgi:hypothetical protein